MDLGRDSNSLINPLSTPESLNRQTTFAEPTLYQVVFGLLEKYRPTGHAQEEYPGPIFCLRGESILPGLVLVATRLDSETPYPHDLRDCFDRWAPL